jgi:hypothetical protein
VGVSLCDEVCDDSCVVTPLLVATADHWAFVSLCMFFTHKFFTNPVEFPQTRAPGASGPLEVRDYCCPPHTKVKPAN